MNLARGLAVATLSLLAIAAVGRFVAPSTLWVARAPGAIDPGDYLFVVKNPFRDRAPEREANRLLTELVKGNCMHALSFFDPATRQEVCRKESEYPLLRWSIAEREDAIDKSRVHFLTSRRMDGKVVNRINVWVELEKRAIGWKAVEFECWY